MLTYVQNIKSKNIKIQIMKKRHFQNQTTRSKLDAMFSNPPELCPRRIPSEMGKVWRTTRLSSSLMGNETHDVHFEYPDRNGTLSPPGGSCSTDLSLP